MARGEPGLYVHTDRRNWDSGPIATPTDDMRLHCLNNGIII